MARSFAVVALIVSAFCFSSVLGARLAPSADPFIVVGKIYCDPCHFQFESRLSQPLEGVKVTLVCRKVQSNNVTTVKVGTTDANGVYKIIVEGDHQDEECEVKAKSSGKSECPLPMINKTDRIVLTKNMGVSSLVRFVNPLGFMTESVDAGQCPLVVSELGLDNLDD